MLIYFSGGDSKTLMVVQVAPVEKNAGETNCSLTFAQRVRQVELGQASRRVENLEVILFAINSNFRLLFLRKLPSVNFKQIFEILQIMIRKLRKSFEQQRVEDLLKLSQNSTKIFNRQGTPY